MRKQQQQDKRQLTCDDLWPLEVLVWMKVARR